MLHRGKTKATLSSRWIRDVRVQIFLIVLLISMICWGGFLFAARGGYRTAQNAGVVPNLHIKQHMGIEDREL